MIGAAVLATGGLRNAVLAYSASPGAHAVDFPREFVLMYGIFYSAVLALVYVPTYARLSEVGRAIRDRSLPAPEMTDQSWTRRYEARTRADEFLQLGLSTSQSFRAGVAILTPLAGSLLGLLIGTSST